MLNVANVSALFSSALSFLQVGTLSFVPTVPWNEAVPVEYIAFMVFKLPSWYGAVSSACICVIFLIYERAAANGKHLPLDDIILPFTCNGMFMPSFVGLFSVVSCDYGTRPYMCDGVPGAMCWTSGIHWVLVLLVFPFLALYPLFAVPCQFKFQIDARNKKGIQVILKPSFVLFFTFIKMALGELAESLRVQLFRTT
jgi:hypothetical protein